MRSIRRLMQGAALLALCPTIGAAQEGRLFTDSWFWGAKAGNMTFWTKNVRHGQAPLFGGEWLITRTHGGLYLSLDQAFFKEPSSIDLGTGTLYQVNMKDMRRFTVAGMVFPTRRNLLRPYAGVGLALNFIQQATAVDPSKQTYADEQKTRAAPIILAGLQFQLKRFSVFGQGSYMPAQDGFLLNNNETYFLEGGIRWNMGSSIDQPGR